MCVNSNNSRCCCGLFSLTTATVLIGILFILNAALQAIAGAWVSFALNLGMASLFGIVIAKPRNASLRKVIFIINVAINVMAAVGFVILLIFFFVTDANENYDQTWCNNYYFDYRDQLFSSYQDCLSFINTWLILGIVTVILVWIPCTACILQILYLGWKEQENRVEQREAPNVVHYVAVPPQQEQQRAQNPDQEPTAAYLPNDITA